MKSGYYFLAASLLLNSPQSWAADQPMASSPAMGRLFFTPSERASLDTIRQNSKAPDKLIKANESDKEEHSIDTETEPSKPVIVRGYVGRSDGKNTIWVNDKAMTEHSSSKDITVGKLQKNVGKVQVTSQAEKKTVVLKAGQVYDPNTNKTYNYISELPVGDVAEEKPGQAVDNIEKKPGLDEARKKTSGLADPSLQTPEPESTTAERQ